MLAMIVITAASIGAFSLALWLTGIVSTARGALATTQDAMQAMRDPALDDDAREVIVRRSAIKLVSASGWLILQSLVALAAGGVPILLADWTGIASHEATFAFLERWDVILIATAAVTLSYILGRRVWSR